MDQQILQEYELKVLVKLIILMLFVTSNMSLTAMDGLSRNFYYVTEEQSSDAEAPRIWFTENEDGSYENRIESVSLSADGNTTTRYLHCESTGLTDITLTATPLENAEGSIIEYDFVVEGGIKGEKEESYSYGHVSADIIDITVVGTADPGFFRIRRLYSVSWTPDIDSINEAKPGEYECYLKVVVTYA